MAKLLRERHLKAIYSLENYETIATNYEKALKLGFFPLIDNHSLNNRFKLIETTAYHLC